MTQQWQTNKLGLDANCHHKLNIFWWGDSAKTKIAPVLFSTHQSRNEF
jgi:hypothetical protein